MEIDWNEYNVRILGEYTGIRGKVLFECNECENKWESLPQVVKTSKKKYGMNGCPTCNQRRRDERYREKQAANLASLPTFINVVSEWNGTRNFQGSAEATKVTFRNNICGHEFETYPNYVLSGKTECTICGEIERIEGLKDRNKARRFYDDQDEWMVYKNRCAYLTRKTYMEHLQTLNPNEHRIGKCGVEGAYQIDHIFPLSLGYQKGIPPEEISHVDNLRVISWEDNNSKRAEEFATPLIFRKYLVDTLIY